MDERKTQLVDEDMMKKASVAPPDPEERAFTGHPDHPPASPDQPVDGNQELLRQPEEAGVDPDKGEASDSSC